VTDDQGNILGLPPMPSAVDFDVAGPGICFIWRIAYDGAITGLEVDLNTSNIQGCFSLSTPVQVTRINASGCNASGGTLTGGPFTFDSVGDGVPDNIPVGAITTSNTNGQNLGWVVTDDQGYILGLPPMPSAVNFDTPGAGTCLVWRIAYDGAITGLEMGMNANNIQGCFSLSNPIEVIRNNASGCNANGGELFGGPFTFDAVGDGVPDMIPAGSIASANVNGDTLRWVVTDDQGYILGLPPMPSAVNFDTPGAGTCLIWRLAHDGPITGLAVGMNANNLQGCFSLSTPVEVFRNNASGCNANGGELFGGPFTFNSVGDGVADTIAAGSITVANSQGDTTIWVVTDSQGYILGLPPMPSAVNFDNPGSGTCLIWHLAVNDTNINGDTIALEGLGLGLNANNLTGCFSLSNPIEVIRNNASGCQANGGELFGGPFIFDSVGDGIPDMIPAGSITLANNQGMNTQWIVTDDQGLILGLPPMPSVVDFDPQGNGICLVWHLSYDGAITGLELGLNANDITGCTSLSNPITVERSGDSGGVPPSTSDVVINEINNNGQVELLNVSNTTIDISNYWLCNFSSGNRYQQISGTTIVCGNSLVLAPGEFVTVQSSITIGTADGEMGLYNSSSFGSSAAMLDYVEWGFTGHGRSSVAVGAGIWTTGDFAPSFTTNTSLEYDGTGDSGSDWSVDAPSPCAANLGSPVPQAEEVFTLAYTIYPNPSSEAISLEFNSEVEGKMKIQIVDAMGRIQLDTTMDAKDMEGIKIDELQSGNYYMKVIQGRRVEMRQFLIVR